MARVLLGVGGDGQRLCEGVLVVGRHDGRVDESNARQSRKKTKGTAISIGLVCFSTALVLQILKRYTMLLVGSNPLPVQSLDAKESACSSTRAGTLPRCQPHLRTARDRGDRASCYLDFMTAYFSFHPARFPYHILYTKRILHSPPWLVDSPKSNKLTLLCS